MTVPDEGRTVDATRLIGLTSPAARIVMWLFVASNFVYAFATIHEVKHAEPVILAVLLVNAAAIMVVRTHPDPFPLRWTAAILAAVALSTVLVAFQLPDVGSPGRASWHLGSNTWLLFFLSMRRRPGAAWAGYAIMAAITAEWSISAGRGIRDAVYLLDTHAAILLVATLFALNIRRTARQINDFDRRAVNSTIEAAEAAAAAQTRKTRVVELRVSAGHLLESLVTEGPPIGLDAKRRFAAVEALLRDDVRGRSLMTPEINKAVHVAREAGVSVTLLDDRGEGLESDEAMMRMTEVVVEQLEALTAGEITVRLAPRGRTVAVSIVASREGHHSRIELDARGNPLEGVSVEVPKRKRSSHLEVRGPCEPARPEGFEPPTF